MKIITCFILVYIHLITACYGSSAIIVRRASGLDWTDITFFARMESANLVVPGDDHSENDKTWAATGTPLYNTDAVKYGVNGLDCSTSNYFVTINRTDLWTSAEFRIGAWFYINTFVNTTLLMSNYKDASNSWYVSIDSNDELKLFWEDNNDNHTFETSDSPLGTGAWYFIEVAIKTSTNFRGLWINGVEKLNTTADTIAAFASGEANNFNIGVNSNDASDLYVENVVMTANSALSLYLYGQATAYGQ